MSRVLFLLGLVFLQGCISNKSPKLTDFHFLIGQWHSLGTDLNEQWSLRNDSLCSKSTISKNDSMVEVDQSCIIQKNNQVYLISHINSAIKVSNTYKLIYDSEESKWVFKNSEVYPQVIFYELREKEKTIYSFAINNKNKVEFLFEKID